MRPPGTLIRIMKWPSFGRCWYTPYHLKLVRALLVHAVPFEAHEVAGINAAEAGLGVFVDVGQHVQARLLLLQPLFFGYLDVAHL